MFSFMFFTFFVESNCTRNLWSHSGLIQKLTFLTFCLLMVSALMFLSVRMRSYVIWDKKQRYPYSMNKYRLSFIVLNPGLSLTKIENNFGGDCFSVYPNRLVFSLKAAFPPRVLCLMGHWRKYSRYNYPHLGVVVCQGRWRWGGGGRAARYRNVSSIVLWFWGIPV